MLSAAIAALLAQVDVDKVASGFDRSTLAYVCALLVAAVVALFGCIGLLLRHIAQLHDQRLADHALRLEDLRRDSLEKQVLLKELIPVTTQLAQAVDLFKRLMERRGD